MKDKKDKLEKETQQNLLWHIQDKDRTEEERKENWEELIRRKNINVELSVIVIEVPFLRDIAARELLTRFPNQEELKDILRHVKINSIIKEAKRLLNLKKTVVEIQINYLPTLKKIDRVTHCLCTKEIDVLAENLNNEVLKIKNELSKGVKQK